MRIFEQISSNSLPAGWTGKVASKLAIFGLVAFLASCQSTGVVLEDQAVNERIEIAGELFENGRVDQAIALLEKSSDLETSNPAPDIALAEIHYDLGNYERAEGHYRVAIRKRATFDARLGLGRTLLSLGRHEGALAELQKATKQKQSRSASLAYAVTLDAALRHGEAQAVYQSLINLDAEDLEARNNLALSIAVSGDTAGAKSMLESLTVQYPQYTAFRHNLALVHVMRGNKNKAWRLVKSDITRKAFNRNVKVIQSTYRS